MEFVNNGWSDFFVAAAGAAGALVGLSFVAISINLARIIELPGVAGRAAETIVLLSGTLAGSLVALMPHLTSRQLGEALLREPITALHTPPSEQCWSKSRRSQAYGRAWHSAVCYRGQSLPLPAA
jgi:hypothetical protein